MTLRLRCRSSQFWRRTVLSLRGQSIALGLVLGLVACGDPSRILSPDGVASAPIVAAGRATVSCVVLFGADHSVSSFQCGTPGDGARTDMTTRRVKARLLIGGQNVYVTLGFVNFAYNTTTRLFSFDATLQNLMAQPLGTMNGSTAAPQGTRIFVIAGPTVTSGTGTITIPSDSGTATFTAPNQPYWQYTGVLKPDSTTASSNWKFQLPPNTGGIQFAVEVSAPIPAEHSVLRWEVLRQGLSDSSYNGTWRGSSTNIYAVGNGSTVAT